MNTEQRILIVTPEQFQQGFRVLRGVTFDHRTLIVDTGKFKLIRRLPDGNYLVEDPE